jgi:hypothetical protein
LDSKRGKFPRFYFLADNDLLEIIGMGKDPRPLNSHLNKIFSGIDSLENEPMPKNSNTKFYIKSIVAINHEEVIELDVGTD